ncbi:MAG: hypothetical protein ABI844_15400 [Saprospiraceae bacterium]
MKKNLNLIGIGLSKQISVGFNRLNLLPVILLIGCLMMTAIMQAQQINLLTVSGRVTDATGTSLPGVAVVV